ncbi:MAG: hypothetical protein AB7P76_09685 [Candidatus Melainabacteria bacterium]
MRLLEKLITLLRIHRLTFMVVFLVCSITIYSVGFLAPPVYEMETSVLVHKKIPNGESKIDLPDFAGPNLTDHVKIMRSDMVLDYLAHRLKKKFPNRDISRAALSSRLRIVSTKNTKVIEITYQDSDRKFGVEVLKGLLDGYEIALKKIAEETKERTYSFFTQRKKQVQNERHRIEGELEVLQSESGTVDINIKNAEMLKVQSSYLETLSNLNSQIKSSRNEIRKLEDTLKLTPEQIQALTRIKEDPQIKSWQEQLGSLQAQMNELKSIYTDRYSAVQEKKRAIDKTEELLEARIREIYQGPLSKKNLYFSNIDQSLGITYLVENVKLIGLEGQRDHYDHLLEALKKDFELLAMQNRKVENLKFKQESLKKEEENLLQRLQDDEIDQAIFDTLGSFSIITEPTMPNVNAYVFPLKPVYTLISGVLVSLLLAMFAVAVVEFLNPRIINLDSLPVLAEINRFGNAVDERELQTVYQNLSLLINRQNLKSLSVIHLCNSGGAVRGSSQVPMSNCPYSSSVFIRQLAVMFSERGLKVLLVDCNDCYESDVASRESIFKVVDYTLYSYSGMDNLHILSPTKSKGMFFDPNMLSMLPDKDTYNLVLFNVSLGDTSAVGTLLCEVAEGTLVGISRSTTPSKTLRQFQQMADEHSINLVGSILFQ